MKNIAVMNQSNPSAKETDSSGIRKGSLVFLACAPETED